MKFSLRALYMISKLTLTTGIKTKCHMILSATWN